MPNRNFWSILGANAAFIVAMSAIFSLRDFNNYNGQKNIFTPINDDTVSNSAVIVSDTNAADITYDYSSNSVTVSGSDVNEYGYMRYATTVYGNLDDFREIALVDTNQKIFVYKTVNNFSLVGFETENGHVIGYVFSGSYGLIKDGYEVTTFNDGTKLLIRK